LPALILQSPERLQRHNESAPWMPRRRIPPEITRSYGALHIL
jgi:hypothetical protein